MVSHSLVLPCLELRYTKLGVVVERFPNDVQVPLSSSPHFIVWSSSFHDLSSNYVQLRYGYFTLFLLGIEEA
jgi:hypothetical protein